jgi:hypothetical protein
LVDEPLGVCGVGGVQDDRACGADGVGVSVVDVGGGMQAHAAVAVGVVYQGEEALAVRSGGLDRGEAGGEVGPVWAAWRNLGWRAADVRAAGCTPADPGPRPLLLGYLLQPPYP